MKTEQPPATSGPEGHPLKRKSSRLLSGARRVSGQAAAGFGRTSWKTRILMGLGGLVILGAIAGTVAVASLPDLEELEAQRQRPLRMEDASGAPLFTSGNRPSGYVPLERIPDHLEQAVVAIEDRRFHDHGGLDFRSISRAFWTNAAAGEIVQGGSTISQQLVKVSYLDPERTYRRKLHEALLTRELEKTHSKAQILEMYLNRIYLGSGAWGVASAAQVYFGKQVEELTLAESALLAASIKAPSVINPRNDIAAAQDRGQVVIAAMVEAGMIDERAANAALAELTVMAPSAGEQPYGGWFADVVGAQGETLMARFTDPGAIRTTLDPRLQRMAEGAMRQRLAGLPMEGALVALRPDGSVAALVGGKDYEASQFNRATQAQRQPGSTFKTFVYLTALADGHRPDSVISDAPIEIDGYAPENFGGTFHGDVRMTAAFAKSLNAATVRLAMDLGIGRVAETARRLGIDAELSETPSLALGASGLSLLDLTEAYGALATGRAPFQAHFVEGITAGAEQTFYPFEWKTPKPDERTAQLMAQRENITAMLRAVVTDGTGQAVAGVPGAVGKTGTSQNFRDALFVGWTPELIVGVWVGNDDNSPMDNVTGGKLPAQIWADFQLAAAGLEPLTSDAVPQDPEAQPQAEALSEIRPQPRDEDLTEEAAEEAPVAARVEAPGPEAQPEAQELDDALGAALARIQSGGGIDRKEAEKLRKDVEKKLKKGDVQGLRDLVVRSLGEPVGNAQCNIRACERAFRSFRASDCTYQPYGGGPRKLCTEE